MVKIGLSFPGILTMTITSDMLKFDDGAYVDMPVNVFGHTGYRICIKLSKTRRVVNTEQYHLVPPTRGVTLFSFPGLLWI